MIQPGQARRGHESTGRAGNALDTEHCQGCASPDGRRSTWPPTRARVVVITGARDSLLRRRRPRGRLREQFRSALYAILARRRRGCPIPVSRRGERPGHRGRHPARHRRRPAGRRHRRRPLRGAHGADRAGRPPWTIRRLALLAGAARPRLLWPRRDITRTPAGPWLATGRAGSTRPWPGRGDRRARPAQLGLLQARPGRVDAPVPAATPGFEALLGERRLRRGRRAPPRKRPPRLPGEGAGEAGARSTTSAHPRRSRGSRRWPPAKSDGDAKILAGGQSLVPLLNLRLARPSVLVDINRVPASTSRRGPTAAWDRRPGAARRARAPGASTRCSPRPPADRARRDPNPRHHRRQPRPRRPGRRAARGRGRPRGERRPCRPGRQRTVAAGRAVRRHLQPPWPTTS